MKGTFIPSGGLKGPLHHIAEPSIWPDFTRLARIGDLMRDAFSGSSALKASFTAATSRVDSCEFAPGQRLRRE